MLEYRQGEGDCTAEAALRLSWMMVGVVGYGVVTVGVFLLAWVGRMPGVLGMLPVWLVVAAALTVCEGRRGGRGRAGWVVRWVGQGAMVGAVMVWCAVWGVVVVG
ncbi:MAG: hypothetical protein ACTHN5_00765 [Phycisphaerae bacterium]